MNGFYTVFSSLHVDYKKGFKFKLIYATWYKESPKNAA